MKVSTRPLPLRKCCGLIESALSSGNACDGDLPAERRGGAREDALGKGSTEHRVGEMGEKCSVLLGDRARWEQQELQANDERRNSRRPAASSARSRSRRRLLENRELASQEHKQQWKLGSDS